LKLPEFRGDPRETGIRAAANHMTSIVEQLVWLAREVGRESLQLVVPGDGTVSASSAKDRLFVSPANVFLNRLESDAVAECDAGKLLELFDMPDSGATLLRQSQVDPNRNAPGIDAVLHAWLLQLEGVQFVAQLNPTACLQVLCSPGGERFAGHRMFPGEVTAFGSQAVYVPYSDVGILLAREVRSKVMLSQRRNQGQVPRLVMIQNYCHRALQNQPAKGTSKPASPRWGGS